MGTTLQSEHASRDGAVATLAPWFHNLHLPDGSQTAPQHQLGDFPAFKWKALAPTLPADLSGWRVLDIGCNAGFYSFELARRGAHVTGLDSDPHYLKQARWAARRFGLTRRVHFVRGSVYELVHWRRRFDLVWFTGVLYHLRYPLLALDLVRTVTGRLLMFQSLTFPGEEVATVPRDLPLSGRSIMRQAGWPKLAFVEHALAGDPTNWWAPNHACVEAVLRSAGFRVRARPAHEFYLCTPEATAGSEDLRQLRRQLRRRA